MSRDRYWKEPNLAPTNVVRQHTAARMYLSHFAVDGHIAVYDFDKDRQFDASVNDVAVQTGFYNVYVGRRKLSTETWLSAIEGAASAIIRRVVGSPNELLALPAADEEALSRFICAQMFRVQAFRDRDAAMRQQLLDRVKEAGRAFLERTETPEDAEKIWAAWATKPDEWFLREEEPYQPAKTATFMLSEVQGFANALRQMPWRIGIVDPGLSLYTSDNAVSKHPVPTIRFNPFQMWWYFLPLAPLVLLQIGPRFAEEGQPKRVVKDFTAWETSFARHIVSKGASRFLYGPGPYLAKECAAACLSRLDQERIQDAVWLQGFNPAPLRGVVPREHRAT